MEYSLAGLEGLVELLVDGEHDGIDHLLIVASTRELTEVPSACNVRPRGRETQTCLRLKEYRKATGPLARRRT